MLHFLGLVYFYSFTGAGTMGELELNVMKMPSYLKEILKQDVQICLVYNKVVDWFIIIMPTLQDCVSEG